MPHSYAQNVVHVIFSTKDRRRLLSKEFQPKLWAYVAGVCKNHQMHVDAIGGTDDHIHLLIRIPAAVSVAKAVLTIKSNSSKWANEQGRRFTWQEGYAAFSVSASLVPRVARYQHAGGPSQAHDVRHGIHCPIEETRREIRCELRVRMNVSHLRRSDNLGRRVPSASALG
jgi:putative transposase